MYDYRGKRVIDENNVEGYTMEVQPQWENGKVVNCYAPTAGDIGGLLNGTNNVCASDFIPIKGRNSLLVRLPWSTETIPVNYGICFYDENKQALTNYVTGSFWGWKEGDSVEKVKTAEVFFPRNAKYFRTTYWSETKRQGDPNIPEFTYTFTPGIYEDDTAITNEIPASRGMLNAIRRARQLTDIKWTPKVKIPRLDLMDESSDVNFLDWFMPNVEYQGIPYSGSGQTNHWQYGVIDPTTDSGKWGYYMFFLGLAVDFETFMTAIRYPNSIFGERVNWPEASTDSSIYGNVCTALLSYALGLKMPVWPIGAFMTNASYGKNYFYKLGEVGSTFPVDKICLGDVFHNSHHVAIITDITRDTSGNITHIEISEATTRGNCNNTLTDGSSQYGGKSRRKNYSIADFMNSYWTTRYSLYRFKNFSSVDYTPSPYVNTGREANGSPIVDLSCMPYLGNKAKYKEGYIVNTKILIGATGFTDLVVTKDGEAFGTFPINGATEISVGFSAPGSYEAHLEGADDSYSTSCYWTVESM